MHPSLFLSPGTKWPSENQPGDLGSAVSSPVGYVQGKAPAANAFQCIFSSRIAPGGNIFWLSLLEWWILKHFRNAQENSYIHLIFDTAVLG